MTGMHIRPTGAGDERPIEALIAGPIPKPRPLPPPLPTLPPLRLPTDLYPDALVLGTARLDSSGRLFNREVLDALGWPPGHRVTIGVVERVLVVVAAPTGLHSVRARGGLSLPAPARQMCGIAPRSVVVLLACPAVDTLVVHPAGTVARLLVDLHTRLGRGDG